MRLLSSRRHLICGIGKPCPVQRSVTLSFSRTTMLLLLLCLSSMFGGTAREGALGGAGGAAPEPPLIPRQRLA